jgi:hypothetical protein
MDELSKSFPKIKLDTYQKTSQVIPGLSLLIVKGPKAFAWFTFLDKRPICIFLHLEGNEIQKISHIYVSFKEHLSLGTILYGTLLKNQFVVENIYYEKGEPLYLSLPDKLERMKSVLEDIQRCEFKESVQFYLPKMIQQHHLLEASNMPYAVYGILSIHQTKLFLLNPSLCTFLARHREEMEDVYDLFALDDAKQLQFHSTALLNDFKTSHFMKKYAFKNKPTYKTVELSDSEEESSLGDFVVQCLFIPEFKRWKPYTSKSSELSFLRDIIQREYFYK